MTTFLSATDTTSGSLGAVAYAMAALWPLLLVSIGLAIGACLSWLASGKLAQRYPADYPRYAAIASPQNRWRWVGMGATVLAFILPLIGPMARRVPFYILVVPPVLGLIFHAFLLRGEQTLATPRPAVPEADLTPRHLTNYTSRTLITLAITLPVLALGCLAYELIPFQGTRWVWLALALPTALLLAVALLTTRLVAATLARPCAGTPLLPTELDERLRRATMRPALANLALTGLALLVFLPFSRGQIALTYFAMTLGGVMAMYLIALIIFPTPMNPPKAPPAPRNAAPSSPSRTAGVP